MALCNGEEKERGEEKGKRIDKDHEEGRKRTRKRRMTQEKKKEKDEREVKGGSREHSLRWQQRPMFSISFRKKVNCILQKDKCKRGCMLNAGKLKTRAPSLAPSEIAGSYPASKENIFPHSAGKRGALTSFKDKHRANLCSGRLT